MFTSNFKYKLLVIVASILIIPAFASPLRDKINKKEVVKWAVQKTSTLRITGKTNVAGFGCDIKGYYSPDTILYSKADDPKRLVPLKGALSIDVNNFDCHNRMLTNDLRKTLKADQHRYMSVRFVALERMPAFANNRDVVKGWVEVELAGAVKRFEICYKLEKTGSVIQLNGARSFSFSDFKLTPPQKLGGIVKVKDDFFVDFRLVLNEVK